MKPEKFLIYISSLLFAIFLSTTVHSNESIEINGDGNVAGNDNVTGDNNQVYKQECHEGATCINNYPEDNPTSRERQDISHETNLSPVQGRDERFIVETPSAPTESLLEKFNSTRY